MWPFSKKDDDELAAFEKELGINKDVIPEEPKSESYDNLASPRDEESLSLRKTYEEQRTQQQQQMPVQASQGDMQVISAKLDTIKAMLDLINQRINSLERNAEEKPKKLW